MHARVSIIMSSTVSMPSTKRKRTVSQDSESDIDKESAAVSGSTTRHRTSHRFCPHCCEVVSHKTFQFHKRLYYDIVGFLNKLGANLCYTWFEMWCLRIISLNTLAAKLHELTDCSYFDN